MTRECTKCGIVKHATEFEIKRGKPGARCIECRREYGRRYYAANRERRLAYSTAYAKANPEVVRRAGRKFDEAHREERAAAQRERRKNPKVVARERLTGVAYRQRFPEKAREKYERRRARLANVEYDPTLSIEALREHDGDYCCYCGVTLLFNSADIYLSQNATFEHITPISRGGNHTFDNAALSCRRCNLSKRDRVFLWEWFPEFMKGGERQCR